MLPLPMEGRVWQQFVPCGSRTDQFGLETTTGQFEFDVAVRLLGRLIRARIGQKAYGEPLFSCTALREISAPHTDANQLAWHTWIKIPVVETFRCALLAELHALPDKLQGVAYTFLNHLERFNPVHQYLVALMKGLPQPVMVLREIEIAGTSGDGGPLSDGADEIVVFQMVIDLPMDRMQFVVNRFVLDQNAVQLDGVDLWLVGQ